MFRVYYFFQQGRDVSIREFVLLVCLSGGAIYDVRHYRVPNWWIAVGAAVGIGLEVFTGQGPPWGAAGFLLRAAAAVTVFFMFFCCRMIGAGDIKLMALICGYLGMKAGAEAIGCSFLVGAIWSLFRLIRLRILLKRLFYFTAYIRQVLTTGTMEEYYNPLSDGYEITIPFALCLTVGTFFRTMLLPLIE